MKIALIDTVYPEFLKTAPLQGGTYAEELELILSRRFGTFDAYSRNLRMLGWEAVDIIANHEALQRRWADDNEWGGGSSYHSGCVIAQAQMGQFQPDVIFLQDLSLYPAELIKSWRKAGYILAGQCSCRFEDDEILKQFNVLFTSFPFYVERFNKLGVRGVFLPLAFDPVILEQARIPATRTHAVSFVGGYGRHWDADALFTKLAEETPIEFWGYGFERAPEVVRKGWRGECWGIDMYEIYLRSHIVVNRHGGIAGGYSNNLRMFEATGCGALLLTERSKNIDDYFSVGEVACYETPDEAVEKINSALNMPDTLPRVAAAGQAKTLSKHTYQQRMPIVSEVLKEELAKVAV